MKYSNLKYQSKEHLYLLQVIIFKNKTIPSLKLSLIFEQKDYTTIFFASQSHYEILVNICIFDKFQKYANF